MTPYEIRQTIQSLPILEKMALIECHKMLKISTLRSKAKDLNISYKYLVDMIELWKFEGLDKLPKQYNFEADTKDLSFTERLQIALKLNNYKYEDTILNTPS